MQQFHFIILFHFVSQVIKNKIENISRISTAMITNSNWFLKMILKCGIFFRNDVMN